MYSFLSELAIVDLGGGGRKGCCYCHFILLFVCL